MVKEIENIVHSFFEKLWVSFDSLEITEDEPCIFSIQIQTQESGILIWPHGKNLEAIQGILRLLSGKKVEEKIRIHLKINDYQDSKDERLFHFITSKIQWVKKSGKNVELPFYWAYERKKIHSFIADLNDNSIFTQSIWEWKDRRLHICKKNDKMMIDIDGDDI